MSQALQRVIVRLLFDPVYVADVYGGGPTPELSADERRMLLATDRRAWGTDPYRRSRGLRALIEEFPVSSAVASGGGAHLKALDAFFSSPSFHAAIQRREHLALAYGAWLGDDPMAVLETALARARRPRVVEGAGVVRTPGVVPITVRDGSLSRWQALRERLGGDPLAALVAGVDLAGLPPFGDGDEHWIAWPVAGGEVSLGGGSGGVNMLLEAAATPLSRHDLEVAAVELGAEPDDAAEIVRGLVEDGLLVTG